MALRRASYESLLGRQPDKDGGAHYAGVLAHGERRLNVARALALSDEFETRWSAVPCDVQLCELANPAKWENPDWIAAAQPRSSDDRVAMHRKPYELTQFRTAARSSAPHSERLGREHRSQDMDRPLLARESREPRRGDRPLRRLLDRTARTRAIRRCSPSLMPSRRFPIGATA